MECRRVKQFCPFFRTLHISNFFVLYERLSYASSNEYNVPSTHLKKWWFDSVVIEYSCINQAQVNLPISHGALLGTLHKTFDHTNLVYSPHLLYYIQGHILASHDNTHGSALCNLYDIPASSCHAEGCPAPRGPGRVKLIVSLQLVELRFSTSLSFIFCLHCHQ